MSRELAGEQLSEEQRSSIKQEAARITAQRKQAAFRLSALTSVADEMPAVILLDIRLPHMDGYHICQIIRKNLQFRQIPIIMLSGKDGLFDKMRGWLAGSTGKASPGSCKITFSVIKNKRTSTQKSGQNPNHIDFDGWIEGYFSRVLAC